MQSGMRKKRRWRYSLRALLLLVTVIGIGLAWWVNGPRKQAQVIHYIREQGGLVESRPVAGQWLADRLDGLYGVRVRYVLLDGHAATDEALIRLRHLTHLESLSIGRGWGTAYPGGIRANEVAPLTDRGMESLGRLTSLKRLEIVGAYSVSEEGLSHLSHLENLGRLEFIDTPVTDEGLERIAESLPNLWSLSLRGTEVTDEGLRHVKRLVKLGKLELNHTSVGDPGMQHIKELKKLKWIDLTATQVTDEGLQGLDTLPLRAAVLKNTQVSDAGLQHLQRIETLEYAGLTGTSVTRSGVEELDKALPKLQIEWLYRVGREFRDFEAPITISINVRNE